MLVEPSLQHMRRAVRARLGNHWYLTQPLSFSVVSDFEPRNISSAAASIPGLICSYDHTIMV